MAVPNPEQTASLFSFFTYIWLEPTVWRAYRLPHLPTSELPPLCDYDEVGNLIKQSYPVRVFLASQSVFSHESTTESGSFLGTEARPFTLGTGQNISTLLDLPSSCDRLHRKLPSWYQEREHN